MSERDIVELGRDYVAQNAAESGADSLILDLCDEAASLRARAAELEGENAQHVEEIGRLHADILKLRGWEATPDGMRDLKAENVRLREVGQRVLSANDDFRAGMPAGWEGDPLQDACADLRAVLANAPAK